jgi:predicted alpha/beta-hydrolase family hydrolase
VDYIITGDYESLCKVTSFEQGGVAGLLHEPEQKARGAMVLTHGAGGNCQARLLVTVADAFCLRGWLVLRYDLPFRRARRSGPPSRYSADTDQQGIREAIAELRRISGGPVIAAGHSYGGRQTTMLAAKQPELCDAVIAFSYPLHPPEKPNQLRTAHFPDLKTSVLFVHGTADPFGNVVEMEAAITAIPAKTRLVSVEGAGHDLKSGKFDVNALVIEEMGILLAG